MSSLILTKKKICPTLLSFFSVKETFFFNNFNDYKIRKRQTIVSSSHTTRVMEEPLTSQKNRWLLYFLIEKKNFSPSLYQFLVPPLDLGE